VTPPPSGGSGSSGNNGQWQRGNVDQHKSSISDSGSVSNNDGQWHSELYGGSTSSQQASSKPQQASSKPQQAETQAQQPPQTDSQPSYTQADGQKPDPKVEKELNAYLASLYGGKVPSKRMLRQKRWASYQASALEPVDDPADTGDVSEDGAADPPAVDPMSAAFLIRLNSMADTLFTLVKFASTYLDQAPPNQGYTTNGSNGSASVPMLAGTGNVDYTRQVPRQ
jgi:hypothetical protein